MEPFAIENTSKRKKRKIIVQQDTVDVPDNTNHISLAEIELEAIELADSGNFALAITRFNHCIAHSPTNYKLYEMKAQCLLEVGRTFEAIQAATVSTQLNDQFPFGFQTLARAQMNFGEIQLALQSFNQAKTCFMMNESKFRENIDILNDELAQVQRIYDKLEEPKETRLEVRKT